MRDSGTAVVTPGEPISTRSRPLESVLPSPNASSSAYLPMLLAAISFAILFWAPFTTLLRDWWSDPDAGHGLLLAPLAVILMWKRGIDPLAKAQPRLGLLLLIPAVLLRYLSGLAAELFTLRASMLGAAIALIVFAFGVRQALRWWVPLTLLILSIPLPDVVTGTLALPLQFKASQLGAAMLEWRNVPVALRGNVIHLPGRALFVTEACSGLRSMTSLLAIGVLIAGLWLKSPVLRVLLIGLAIPIAVLLNGVRVFLTGFLVYFVDPKLGDGMLHMTEGWVIFVVAFIMLGAIAWFMVQFENWRKRA